MDIITLARQLGAAIQKEEAYARYQQAKDENDKDEALQNLIGEFNLQRVSLSAELQKSDDEKSQSKIDELNRRMQELYHEIMSNATMSKFNDAKVELDDLMQRINSILMQCVNGEDPETCEESACSGSCESCGGCH